MQIRSAAEPAAATTPTVEGVGGCDQAATQVSAHWPVPSPESSDTPAADPLAKDGLPTVLASSTDDVPLAPVSLDDKYTATTGAIYLSGIQALVRLPLLQQIRDRAAGLNTAGFIDRKSVV